MKKHSILLVEDNPDDELLMIRAFRKTMPDLIVQVARDGRACIDLVDDLLTNHVKDPASLALILLDLKLPKLDGFGVLRHIREELGLRGVPIVILSSSDEKMDIARSYDLGANGFLRKPDTVDAFQKIAETIGKFWLFENKIPGLDMARSGIRHPGEIPDQ